LTHLLKTGHIKVGFPGDFGPWGNPFFEDRPLSSSGCSSNADVRPLRFSNIRIKGYRNHHVQYVKLDTSRFRRSHGRIHHQVRHRSGDGRKDPRPGHLRTPHGPRGRPEGLPGGLDSQDQGGSQGPPGHRESGYRRQGGRRTHQVLHQGRRGSPPQDLEAPGRRPGRVRVRRPEDNPPGRVPQEQGLTSSSGDGPTRSEEEKVPSYAASVGGTSFFEDRHSVRSCSPKKGGESCIVSRPRWVLSVSSYTLSQAGSSVPGCTVR